MSAKKKTDAEAAAEEMTEQATEAEETATEAVPETTMEPDAEKAEAKVKRFQLENLRKNCRALFGVSTCTFAGATAGMTGEYSVDEMKSIIDEWCGKEAR